MFSLLGLLACSGFCLLEWDAVPDTDLAGYRVFVVGEEEPCRETVVPYLDIRGTDCERDGHYQLVIRAFDTESLESENDSRPVDFNLSCLERSANGEGCERPCCDGCVRELRERWPACDEPAGDSLLPAVRGAE